MNSNINKHVKVYRPEYLQRDMELMFTVVPRETVICAEFGCRKPLSLVEQLAGSKCVNHQVKKKLILC